MWSFVIPYFLDLRSSENATYNILVHSQRGHGLSTLPPKSELHERRTTIPLLATDIANILDALSIPTPVRAVIGVSQGGAAALAFAAMFGDKTKGIVACDTAPRTPAGNKEAWEERIRLVRGPEDPVLSEEYAKDTGMSKLAKVTVPRWFPPGSLCSSGVAGGEKPARWVEEMVMRTDVNGFVEGARALGDYDVLGLSPAGVASSDNEALFKIAAERILLLAGNLDGGGKVGKGLQDLSTTWNSQNATFVEIADAGHLPMIDSPAKFCEVLKQWLGTF
jgi:pimeloyl-ACP methyl ester carboxylesterase